MNLAFLTPLLLAGLAALAIPILIHLVHRPDPQAMPFPSLMFLRQIPYRERRRLRIRNWWLLLLRCLALALLALAFARPFFTSADSSGASLVGQRDAVILLDRSYSMGYGDHAERARQAAATAIDSLGGGDRAALLLFDAVATTASELTSDRDALHNALADYRPSASSTDFAGAIEQAVRLLNDSSAPQRELVLISDLQRNGLATDAVLRLPANIKLTLHPVTTSEVSNTGITAVTVKPAPGERDKLELTAQLRAVGQPVTDPVAVRLSLDGRDYAAQTVAFAGQASASTRFVLPPPRELASRAVVHIADDNLMVDNQFYALLPPQRALPLLIFEPQRPRANQSVYLRRALELSTDPHLDIVSKPITAVAEQILTDWAFIVFNDTPLPGGAADTALRDYIANGGGVLIATADGVQGGWPGGSDGYAPGALARRVEPTVGLAISQFDRSHALFEPLASEQSLVPTGAVLRYRELTPSAGDGVLARYQNGAIALAERRLGAGRVLVLTTTLDTAWNELPLQPSFPLFMQRLARYLAGFEAVPAWQQIGTIIDLPQQARAVGTPLPAASTLAVKTPSAVQLRLSSSNPLLTLQEQGFYQVRALTDNSPELLLAANLDSREADLSAFTADQFQARITTVPAAVSAASRTTSIAQQVLQEEQSQRLWWYILLIALGLLALEALYAHWLTRRPAQPV